MKLLSESKLSEKKSKFLGFFYDVESVDEVEEIIDSLKKSNKKAAHVCYAYIIDGEEVFKNDGEVGKPGNTMLELLKSKNKSSHLIAVVRYFGGIKLGPGGVKRAFKETAKSCLE